jgi:hypothetical protein
MVIMELQGFSKTTEQAHGARLYVRNIDFVGNITMSMLYAKFIVAHFE